MTRPPDPASAHGAAGMPPAAPSADLTHQPSTPAPGPSDLGAHPYPQPVPWAVSSAPKPGVVPLRPLGVGEILDGAISYVRANPKVTLGLAAVVATLGQLVELPVRLLGGPGEPTPGLPPELAGFGRAISLASGSGIVQLVNILVAVAVAMVLTGMLISVVGRAVVGQRSTLGEVWTVARPRLLGLLGITLLTILRSGLAGGLLLVGGVAAVTALVAAQAPVWIAVVLGALAFVAAVFAMVFLWLSWSLAPAAYVLERASLFGALRRSRGLVRGQRWRVFGIILLGQVIVGVIGGLLSVIPAGIALAIMVGGEGSQVTSVLGLSLLSISNIASVTITTPFIVGVVGLLYVDQRMRRDGLDIELARHATTDVADSARPVDVFGLGAPPASQARSSATPANPAS